MDNRTILTGHCARSTFFFLCLALFSACTGTTKETIQPLTLKPGPGGTYDPPPVRTYPSPPNTIQTWIDNVDIPKIRAHGWDIWESITTNSGNRDNLPVWETWYSGHELFEMEPTGAQRAGFRDFENPKQFTHLSERNHIPIDPAERPTSFNRYSRSLAEVIWDRGYNKMATLDSINNSFGPNTPVALREISTSTDSVDALSFSLKPVFQFISGFEPTAVPYWAGVSPMTADTLTNPEPHTWKQCVVVDPTGKLKPGSTHRMKCNSVTGDWPVVDVSNMYHVKFTQEEVDNFSQFASQSGDDVGAGNLTDSTDIANMIKVGNYALLMAIHVTGKEIVNWTWQTFWWSHNPDYPPYGNDRPASVPAPWSNYEMRTAYFMVYPPNGPTGQPFVSYNPYLETNLRGKFTPNGVDTVQWYGVFSNCMSCHRLAAIPNSQYVSGGYIDKGDEYLFGKVLKTDFLWSLPVRAD